MVDCSFYLALSLTFRATVTNDRCSVGEESIHFMDPLANSSRSFGGIEELAALLSISYA